YSVTISPKHDGGLLGSAELAWDAEHSVPLRIGIYAQGSSSPALELTATHISYGNVPASDVTITPPSDAKIIDVNPPSPPDSSGGTTTKPDFSIVAPDTLVGLPRQDERTLGKDGQLVVYGKGLGAIVVIEHKADTAAPSGMLSALPSVSLEDGLTAHELATQLGTAIQWTRGGVSFVLFGSLPPAAAEAPARGLTRATHPPSRHAGSSSATARSSRSTASISPSSAAMSWAIWGRTAPARRPRSGCCSA